MLLWGVEAFVDWLAIAAVVSVIGHVSHVASARSIDQVAHRSSFVVLSAFSRLRLLREEHRQSLLLESEE